MSSLTFCVLCRLSQPIARNNLDMTHAHTTHHLSSSETLTKHQTSWMWYSRSSTVERKNLKGWRLLFWSCVWKVTQHYKRDHTEMFAFSLISGGLRSPCWRAKSSPATHHLPPYQISLMGFHCRESRIQPEGQLPSDKTTRPAPSSELCLLAQSLLSQITAAFRSCETGEDCGRRAPAKGTELISAIWGWQTSQLSICASSHELFGLWCFLLIVSEKRFIIPKAQLMRFR